VGKTEGRRPVGRFRRRWKDNITVDLWEVGWGGGGGAWTGKKLVRVEPGGELLRKRWLTFGFHKMREMYWVTEDLRKDSAL
jgi:hypothetical protein